MVFTIPHIAVSTSPDGTLVGRFGHDFPLVAIDAADARTPRQADGCCGNLAKSVADCSVVICTAIGRGAAGHLSQAGVQLAIVPEGTAVAAAVARYRSGELQPGGEASACDHGHEHQHGAKCGHSGG